MKRFLLFTLLLLLSSTNANHFEDASEILNEWDDPNLEIISPENQTSKQVGKSNKTQEAGKRKVIQDSEEKELKDFMDRFYQNLDESYAYDDEYDAEMDYNKRNIGRANWKENRQKKKEKTGITERQLGNVSKTTTLLNKQNRKLKTLEDELIKLILESESSGKKGKGHTWKEIVEKQLTNKSGPGLEKGKGHTWKEILEKQAKGSTGKGRLNNTALLKKQKEDLERVEESLTEIIKKVEEKGEKNAAKKNVDQLIDRGRLREAEQKDQELEERIKGWKTGVESDKAVGPTPKGQKSVGPLVDDIHR